jgi:hypothetical protein
MEVGQFNQKRLKMIMRNEKKPMSAMYKVQCWRLVSCGVAVI